jgi:hypothetical protein
VWHPQFQRSGYGLREFQNRPNKFSGRGHQQNPDNGKNEHGGGERRGGKPHAWLFKFSRRAGKEERGGEKHGVGEILAGKAVPDQASRLSLEFQVDSAHAERDVSASRG